MNDIASDDALPLGELIRTAREAAGLSIRQLAKLVPAHHSLLARIEAGDVTRPGTELLQCIGDVLEIDPVLLFEKIGVKPIMPEPKTYFRRAYGMNEAEAEEAERLIAELRKAHGKDESK